MMLAQERNKVVREVTSQVGVAIGYVCDKVNILAESDEAVIVGGGGLLEYKECALILAILMGEIVLVCSASCVSDFYLGPVGE